jgi:hypothetical protein
MDLIHDPKLAIASSQLCLNEGTKLSSEQVADRLVLHRPF